MRDFKNMKRQRGRNRSGGGPNTGGGGGKLQQNANRAFDSNGPDNVKIRGHAQHVFEKYQQLARDAFSSGDRVVAENYLQHADHYFRVLRTLQPQRSPSEILGRDSLASGLDIDFEEEFDQAEEGSDAAAETTSTDMNGGGDPTRFEGRRDERYDRNETRRDGYEAREPRQDRSAEPRREGEGQYRDRQDTRDRSEGRSDYRDRNDNRDRQSQPPRDRYDNRDRNDQFRDGQVRDGQVRDGQARDGQARDGQNRDGQNRDGQARDGQARDGQNRDFPLREGQDRFDGRRDRRPDGRRDERTPSRERDGRSDERQIDERAPMNSASDPLPIATPETSPQPFPVSAPDTEASPVLRSEDGGMSEAPAFLQPASSDDGEARKPRARRRRAPRSFEAPDGGDASVAEAEDA